MADSGFLCDALFIGAHPDDCELLAGGLMASMARKGRRVILADATAGEMGTRGTADERAREGEDAARILGVTRICLGLPDGGVGTDPEASTRAVVSAFREHRPRAVFTHSGNDHHPDHNAIHAAVRRATFLSFVLKYETGQERHHVRRLFYFWSHRHDVPERLSFIADVSDTWDTKVAAMKAHRSQFADTGYEGPSTFLTDPNFWTRIEARHGYFGSLVRVKYGEPYLTEGIPRMDDPLDFPDVAG